MIYMSLDAAADAWDLAKSASALSPTPQCTPPSRFGAMEALVQHLLDP